MSAHFVGVSHLDALSAFAAAHVHRVSVFLPDISGDPGVALAPGVSADVLEWWRELELDGRADLGGRRAEVFDVLRAENFRSLRARYRGHDDGRAGGMWHPDDETADPAAFSRVLSAVTIIKACHGYTYQACESPEYRQSLACGIVQAIEREAVRRLPGYDDSPGWTLSEADVHGDYPRGAVRSLLEEIEAGRRRKARAAR